MQVTGATGSEPVHRRAAWWRDAVVYQVYIRSFADGNGDGIGDIAGLRTRLRYLADLGVDAIWVNPWYRSPMVDGGYDVADYRAIDELFGDLDDADALIADCHALGIRVIADIVPNHTSAMHRWFQDALRAAPGSPERARYWFRRGRGLEGELPPNDWRSRFGGSAWTRVNDPDGRPGEWYLHLFDAQQPDLNWENSEVRLEFEAILRFWLDRGIDGLRIDVAHGLIKDPSLPDLGERAASEELQAPPNTIDHPHWDRDELAGIYRRWRQIADEYPGDRMFVAEAWVTSSDRLARYLDDGLLHTAFNFHFLTCKWSAQEFRGAIDTTLNSHSLVGAPPTWVLANHDEPRYVTRMGRSDRIRQAEEHAQSPGVDLALGTRRARAAALLLLALPGSAYVYQGEELGLWDVEPGVGQIQDPAFARTGRTRDGCRIPLPWSGDRAPFAFSQPPVAADDVWLPQPAAWSDLTVSAQLTSQHSMLALYRAALELRRQHPALGDGTLDWCEPHRPGVLEFTRAPGFRCVVNLSGDPIELPAGANVLLSSVAVAGGLLPPDAAAWLEAQRQSPV